MKKLNSLCLHAYVWYDIKTRDAWEEIEKTVFVHKFYIKLKIYKFKAKMKGRK